MDKPGYIINKAGDVRPGTCVDGKVQNWDRARDAHWTEDKDKAARLAAERKAQA